MLLCLGPDLVSFGLATRHAPFPERISLELFQRSWRHKKIMSEDHLGNRWQFDLESRGNGGFWSLCEGDHETLLIKKRLLKLMN